MSMADNSNETEQLQSRTEILDRLKTSLVNPDTRFKVPELEVARIAGPEPVTDVDTASNLPALFGTMLDIVGGSHEILDNIDTVPNAVIRHFENLRNTRTEDLLSFDRILSWDPDLLGIPKLGDALSGAGIRLTVPPDLGEFECREDASSIAVGITGTDAALASTGTLVLGTGPGRSRAASLLPLHHIVLVSTSRIHPTIEAWMATVREEGRLNETFRTGNQCTLVTGPSKSADIELTLTLGVHGPRTVHAIVYQDEIASGTEFLPD